MNAASALLSAGIALVFALSAVGKLRTLDSAESTLQALRLPRYMARAAIAALAVVELLVAVALFLPRPINAIAAAASAALALCFLIVVIRAYLLGSREDCGCFGAGESAISTRLILRNVALLAATVLLTVLTWRGVSALTAFTSSDVAETLLVVLATVLLAAVLWLSLGSRGHGAAERDPEVAADMSSAQPPHVVLLEQRTGTPRDITAAASRRAQLLVFIKPGCDSCQRVKAELDRRADSLGAVATPTLIVSALADQIPREFDDARYLLDPADHNARLIGVGHRRPVAVLLATDGLMVLPFARGSDEIVQLLDAVEQAAGV